MLGKIFGIICIAATLFGVATSNVSELGNAVIDGASSAVSLTISLCGMMCLWCGVMKVFERAGLIGRLAKLLSPLMKIFFPDAYKKGSGCSEIAANISANLLGIGNAATPLALCAMKKLQENNDEPERASHDMITLAVMNTASVSIVPSTILALRRAAGSSDPFMVVVPIWINSVCCSLFALILCRAMRGAERGKGTLDKNKNVRLLQKGRKNE